MYIALSRVIENMSKVLSSSANQRYYPMMDASCESSIFNDVRAASVRSMFDSLIKNLDTGVYKRSISRAKIVNPSI